MNKRLVITLASIGIAISSSLSVYAAGWVRSGNDWAYEDENNNRVYNEWKKGADNEWRYLGNNGLMLVNSWADSEQYFVGADGRILTKTWKQIDGSWYYFDEKGKRVSSKWIKVDNKNYYIGEEGKMLTGWILDNMYYLGDNGVMLTGWQKLYPYDNDGNNIANGPDTNGNEDDKKWFYFGSNGKKIVPSSSSSTGYVEKKIDGKRYAFNDKGELVTGWVNVGTSASSAIRGYRYFNADGSIRTGWYSIEPPEDLSGSYDDPVEWFYFDTKGEPKAAASSEYKVSDFVKINGKQYLFDENGNPVYGLRKIYTGDGKYGIYYFGKASECYIQKGKKTVADSDGNSVYYFQETSGKGITGVKAGYIYYKGRLVKAEDDKYEIISLPVENSSNYTNYVVNKSGGIMRNAKVKTDNDTELRTNSQGVLTQINNSTNGIGAKYIEPKEPSL